MERVELSQALGAWLSQVTRTKEKGPRLISEADPQRFMAAFAEAVAGDFDVFLGDPGWGKNERAQVTALLALSLASRPRSPLSTGWLMIPTGGTSGTVKFARHDEKTLSAAVRGFADYFGLRQVNAVGVLPLHHVGGLMAWLRCVLTGGEYRPLNWKSVEGGERPVPPAHADGWTISLVPTQLERLLRDPAAVAWLRGFRLILLGGGPAWPALLERAAAARLPLTPGYGLTETAAMVTALKPADFLAGERSSGATLPHATVGIGSDGLIRIGGESLFRGYYPDWRAAGTFSTADEGRLDEQGRLLVLGRRDGVIISGGEKVNPEEVEGVLRDSGEFSAVVVVGIPDPEWGQVTIAAYPATAKPDLAKATGWVEQRLAAPKRPKRYVPIDSWPANDRGKVNRAEVLRLVRANLDSRTQPPTR